MQDDTRLFRPARAALATLLVFQALCMGLPAAPAISATKDDGVGALVKKPAGSTVTYTNTITNGTGAGITDATGVQFADPDVANATYVPNTLAATPVAVDDVYPFTVIANTSIDTATGGYSVVTNDFAGYSAGTAVLSTALTITNVVAPLHGAVTMTLSGAGVGRFIYTPTAGYIGGDSFTYTISNSVAGGTPASRTATVNLTVGGPVIWFVNPALGSNGTGILGNPFNNLAAAVTAIGATNNQRVFIYSGGAAQTTGITLNSGGWLVGQAAVGASFEALMGGISYPSDTTVARPSINNGTKPGLTRSGGNTVTLGENNLILGLAIGNTGGGYAISGTNINVGQIGNALTSDVDLSSGSTATGAISLTGGSVSFSQAIGDSGTGINLATNTGAAINFTGGLNLSTGSNTAFNATGGGTITATQNNSSIVNTLTTTSGTALNVANTTIGASGITFRSISAGTGVGSLGVGISLNTTGISGGLTVTGNGTAGSGGTIQHKTGSDLSTTAGIGIYLNNTSNVSLARMQLNDFDNFAIRGNGITGFTLNDSVINSAGGSSWNGNNDAGGFNEGSVFFSELTGSATISNTSISGGYSDNVRVVNTTGTLNRITFDTVTIGANHSGAASDGSQDHGNDGIILEALTGSAVLNATVQNSTFTSARGDIFQLANNGTAANDLIFTGNHISNSYPRIATGGGGLTLSSNGFGNLTLSLTNNDFRDSVGAAVLIVKSTGTSTLAGTISNNTIGVAGAANSGSLEGSALKIQSAGGGTVTTLIANNIIRQYNNNGIELLTGGGATAQTGAFNSTITGNTIANPGINPATAAIAKNGIQLNGGTVPFDSYVISLDIGGAGALANSLAGSGAPNDVFAGGEDIRFRQRQDTRVQLRGYTGANNDNAAVVAYAIARNSGSGVPSAIASNQANTGTDGYYNTPGGGPVTQPLIFATGGVEKSGEPAIATAVSLNVGGITDSLAVEPVLGDARLAVPAAPDSITQQQLDTTVSAALARWSATGLTAEQLAVLRGMKFEISTLGNNRLGEASAKLIRVDGNAGGNGWFVDASSASDAMFGNAKSDTRRYTDGAGLPAGRVDLLTTIMHEMGHALGLPDSYNSNDRESIMFGQLTTGERRSPAMNQAAGAKPFAGDASHFLSGGLNPITIGILPPGKSVVITYDVVIDNPFALGATQLSSQGTVHSTTASFTDTLTDDPNVGGASDPTITLLDRPDTTVASISRSTSSPTNTSSVSWTVTFANAVSGLTGSNFTLATSGLGGTPAITAVTPTGGPPATVWTVTASTGTGNGTLGLNLANDTALSHDVLNAPFTGQVYTIDRTPPNATIVLSKTALKVGDTSLVTITFSEAVTGFTNADLTIPNGTLSAVSSGDGGITWTATFTPAADRTAATNVITLDKTGVADLAGNAGVGTAVSPNYAIDTARPTATIVVANDNLMIGQTSLVTITFSEAVTGFTNADLTVENGTLSPVSSGDGGITWTATLTPTPNVTDATNVITLDNTGVADAAGNTGTGTTVSNNYAVTSLSISIVANTPSAAEGTGAGTTAFTFTVTRTGSTAGAVTMNYAVSGAAVDAADFGGTLPAGVFTIPDTQASAILTINVSQDSTVEPDELFTVTLSNASGGYVITGATASATIVNDDFAADLAITVTDGVTTAIPGGSVTYTITASNAGPHPAPTATLVDNFPASLTATWTAVGAGGATAPPSGSGNINATVSLPVGGSVTFTVNATISPAATGTLSNTATISSPVTDPVPANNSATDSDTLTPQADLAITKTDGVTTATPGGSVTYTITASNAGPSNVIGATLADTFPASLTATWTAVGAGGGTAPASGSGNINAAVNLPAGGSVTFTVSASIAASATGSLSNTATITVPGGVTDPTPGNNSATDTDTLVPQADLAITKTDGVTTATAGGSVTYTITASNAGPSNAPSATVADTLPASLTATWTAVGAGGGTAPASGSGNINAAVNLPAGGSVTFTVTATVSAAATGTLSNTATVSSPVTDPVPGNNSATDTDTIVASADLAITKTDGVTTATPGTSVTYTITASNAGPSNVTGATLADTFPASLTGTWTAVGAGGGTAPASGSGNINASVNLPAGGSVTFTVTAAIAPSATGSLSNTATITAPAGVTDPTPANNSATDTDTLTPSADLAITATDGVTTATPGGSVTYTITASNAGPSSVTGATVADTFPASLTATWTAVGAGGGTAPASGSGNINALVNLPAGGSVTFTVSAAISPAATGTLVNTATVSSSVTDPTPGNNSATDTDTLTPQADLTITKTDGVTTATPGTSVTYTITATNAGPSNVTAATVADTLPASISGATWTAVGAAGGTATASGSGNINDTVTLPAGGSVTYTVTAPISASETGTLTNTATVSSSVTDPTPGNNSATDTDTLTPSADLAVSISDSPDPVNAGGNLTYTIHLTNNGPSTAQSPSVGLPVPANTTFVSATPHAGWSSTTPAVGGTGPINFSNGSLASGGSATFTVVVKVDLTVVNNSTLTATTTVSSTTTDPTAGNNSAIATTTAKSGADLQITLADSPDPVIAGTNLTYTLQVANNGPLDADNVSISNTLPAGTTFVSLSAPAGWTKSTPAVGGTGSVTITRPLFANGGSATITLVVKVGPGVANGTIISDTASVSSATLDIIPANNSATTTTTVTTQSDLAIQVTGTPTTAPKGSNITYAITLTNNGPSDASAAGVSLAIPGQMTFVSATAPSGWSATTPAVGSNGTVVFTRSSPFATGSMVNFTVVAKVKSSAPTGSILTATATASSTTADPAPANNTATAIAAVGTVNPTAVQPVTTGIGVTSQTGLFDVIVNVTNTTPLPINGFRLHVNFNAYKAAYPSLRLYNASSAPGAADVYVDFPFPVAVDAVVAMKLSFYTSTRTFPSPFKPVLTVETLLSSQVPDTNGNGVQPRLVRLADKTVLLEFPSVVGKWYRVRFSADMVHWFDCPVPIQAGNSKMQWIDSGPPFTNVPPANVPSRFYIVNEIVTP